MTTRRKLTWAVLGLSVLITIFASGLRYTELLNNTQWLLVAGEIPVLWGAGTGYLWLVEKVGAKRPYVNVTAFLGIVAGVGAMLAWTFGIILADQLHLIEHGSAFVLAMRGSGIIFGLMVLALGNALPKMQLPRPDTLEGEARGQAFKRFAGWTYVLGAFLYIANWLFVPIPFPALLSGILILITFGIAPALYGIWLAVKARHFQH